jgi:N-acetylglutamate synthase-like GNAT family acetyltransferase
MSLWQRNGYVISTEKQFLDTDAIYHFLSEESYWSKGITRETVLKSIENSSICFGVYVGNPKMGKANQVGFVRVVTDFVRFAYIMDVFIVDTYRGKGLSKWLMEIVTEQSVLKDVSSMMLCTNDAHGLYAQYGFQKIENPERYMVRKRC